MLQSPTKLFLACLAILVSFVLAGNLHAQTIIANFSDDTNDRFTDSPSFIGAGLDFSGVSSEFRWATLISNNVIVSANHFRPSSATFYEDNDPSKSPVVRNVTSGQRIGNTDIYLAVLDAPVPSNITSYNFVSSNISAPAFDATTNPNTFPAGTLQNQEVLTVGVSPTSRQDRSQDQAIGRNRIAGYVEDLPFLSSSNVDALVLIQDQVGDPGFVENESQLRTGDSGAPLFVEQDGELVLLGINSFVAADETTTFSGVSFLGNDADQINQFIAANAVASEDISLATVNAIPEPSCLSLALFAIATIGFKRRR